MIRLNKGIVSTSALLAALVLLSVLTVLLPKLQIAPESSVLGSVTQGNEYFSTTTRNHLGTELANLRVLKSGAGSLGSFVITGANTGLINFYDATSTVTNTEWATTTLATFPASTAAGTYTFDVTFSKGLLYEEIGASATGTITWR